MVGGLEWLGARARWALLLGCCAALALPQIGAILRPALPVFVALIYALAMLRIDLPGVARRLIDPRRALLTWPLALAMTAGSAAASLWVARALGAGPAVEAALVFAFLAPPIGSSAAMCLLLGLNAALALEMTVLCSFALPFVAPPVAQALLGAQLTLSPFDLGARMAAMVFGGVALALVLRRLIPPGFIARRARAFDGAATLSMLVFAFPLFDGVAATLVAEPALGLGLLALSCLILLGPQIAGLALARGPDAGAAGLVWGMRSVAIFLAALPPEPRFSLFVALYQFPMYGTPLLLGALYRRRSARNSG
ncbi:MAG: hypothetical protein ACFCUS_03080 [Rubrimonas sp.]|uniref:hypothetical protein n=1 Tax=Rubrimonas sp. TaxID=2036015 RepID=UPI002FDEEF1A